VDNDDLLAPNTEVQVLFVRERPLRIELPTFVELAVARTDPGVKGDTVSNVYKPAELETGATVSVPLFVNQGDVLRIDTRTREYATRV
jgi:elongation factor P